MKECERDRGITRGEKGDGNREEETGASRTPRVRENALDSLGKSAGPCHSAAPCFSKTYVLDIQDKDKIREEQYTLVYNNAHKRNGS